MSKNQYPSLFPIFPAQQTFISAWNLPFTLEYRFSFWLSNDKNYSQHCRIQCWERRRKKKNFYIFIDSVTMMAMSCWFDACLMTFFLQQNKKLFGLFCCSELFGAGKWKTKINSSYGLWYSMTFKNIILLI